MTCTVTPSPVTWKGLHGTMATFLPRVVAKRQHLTLLASVRAAQKQEGPRVPQAASTPGHSGVAGSGAQLLTGCRPRGGGTSP